MHPAKTILIVSSLIGVALAIPPIPINAIAIPLETGAWGWHAADIGLAPAGFKITATDQFLSQIAQANRLSFQNALIQAQQIQSLGNQARNQLVRDNIQQLNAERTLASLNSNQNLRSALNQAQQAQVQVSISNNALKRNLALQALQGNKASDAQAISTQVGLNLAKAIAGTSPVLISSLGPAISPLRWPSKNLPQVPVLNVGIVSNSKYSKKSKIGPKVSKSGLKDQIAVEAPVIAVREAAPPSKSGLSHFTVGTVGWGRKSRKN